MSGPDAFQYLGTKIETLLPAGISQHFIDRMAVHGLRCFAMGEPASPELLDELAQVIAYAFEFGRANGLPDSSFKLT